MLAYWNGTRRIQVSGSNRCGECSIERISEIGDHRGRQIRRQCCQGIKGRDGQAHVASDGSKKAGRLDPSTLINNARSRYLLPRSQDVSGANMQA